MSADDRREQVLLGATRAFARTGYVGTTTDAVAREAGVSQPYVVRIFGTKLDLFVEVLDRATRRVLEAFERVVETAGPLDVDAEDGLLPLGVAYGELVLGDRDVVQVMMHGFLTSAEPAIGELARRRMGEIFAVLRRTGCTDDQARDFIAQGMLLNVMLALDAPENAGRSEALDALAACSFGPLLEALPGADVPAPGSAPTSAPTSAH